MKYKNLTFEERSTKKCVVTANGKIVFLGNKASALKFWERLKLKYDK